MPLQRCSRLLKARIDAQSPRCLYTDVRAAAAADTITRLGGVVVIVLSMSLLPIFLS